MTDPLDLWRGYDVLEKWNTPSWDDTTRRVVAERIEEVPPRRFFDEAEYSALEALCDTVVRQPDRDPPVPIAPWIDAAMVENRTNGTRFAPLPTMREAWRRGLHAIDAEAQACHGRPFASLAPDDRDALLKRVDDEDTRAEAWRDLPPRLLFRNVLANEIARVFYAHPDAWSEIGFGGPASPRGYVRLQPNRRDAWEARRSGGRR